MRFSLLMIVAGIVVGVTLNILFGGFLILAGIGLTFIERAQPPAQPGPLAPPTADELQAQNRKARRIVAVIVALMIAGAIFYFYWIIFP